MLDKNYLLNSFSISSKINNGVNEIKNAFLSLIKSLVSFLACTLCLVFLRFLFFVFFPYVNINDFISSFNPLSFLSQEAIMLILTISLLGKFIVKLCVIFATTKIVLVLVFCCVIYIKRGKEVFTKKEFVKFFNTIFSYKSKVKFLN